MADLVIFGAGQIAAVAKAYIDAHGSDRVVGFTVDAHFKTTDSFEGLPLVAWDELEAAFPPECVRLLGPLSFRSLNELRRDRYLEGKRRGYAFASFVHPGAFVSTKDIGENAFILENNVIQPFVRIGVCVMMWSGNHIGHHSRIGDYCFFGSQNGVSGGVTIGDGTFVGGQVGIGGGLSVGRSCFLADAAVVLADLPDNSVVIGAATKAKPYSSERLKRRL